MRDQKYHFWVFKAHKVLVLLLSLMFMVSRTPFMLGIIFDNAVWQMPGLGFLGMNKRFIEEILQVISCYNTFLC